MSDPVLNDASLAMLAEPVIANVATVDASGAPHVTAVWVDVDGGDDRLAKKYLGVDTYPMRQPGEKRVKIRIRPDRVLMQPAAGGAG